MDKIQRICDNPWCKAPFTYTEDDVKTVDGQLITPKQCPKCQSFSTELSGGVSWSEKNYEGSIYDDGPHQIRYKVTNYK